MCCVKKSMLTCGDHKSKAWVWRAPMCAARSGSRRNSRLLHHRQGGYGHRKTGERQGVALIIAPHKVIRSVTL